MAEIFISDRVKHKLNTKHGGVTPDEIRQCFANREGPIKIDTREDHITNPYTRWFISETDSGRELKVCYIPFSGGNIHIKTVFEPDERDKKAYEEP